jgi:hypothetical protein
MTMDKPKPISLRMNAESKEMLGKLAKQFSIPEASVMRMALKQLHDRTFPAPKALRVPKALPSDLYLEGVMERIPTGEEVVDRIIKGS